MSLGDQTAIGKSLNIWQKESSKRWTMLGVVLGILLLMGFYTITDSSHLTNSLLLKGSDWAGYALCHRITERSFSINGRQFPLCARCSGMYLGVTLVLTTVFLSGRMRRANIPSFRLLVVLLVMIGLMGIDGVNSYSHFFPGAPHLYQPQNWLRLATGMGTGLAMGIILLAALAQTLWREPYYQAAVRSGRELIGLILIAFIAVLLILSNQPLLLYVLAVASVGGLLFIVTALNTIILLVLFRREGLATSWVQTVLPLCLGLLITVIELGIIAYLRFDLTGTMTGFPGL